MYRLDRKKTPAHPALVAEKKEKKACFPYRCERIDRMGQKNDLLWLADIVSISNYCPVTIEKHGLLDAHSNHSTGRHQPSQRQTKRVEMMGSFSADDRGNSG